MKNSFIKIGLIIAIAFAFFSCGNSNDEAPVKKLNADSILKANENQLKLATLDSKPQAAAEGLALACLSLCAVQDLVTLGRLVVL